MRESEHEGQGAEEGWKRKNSMQIVKSWKTKQE